MNGGPALTANVNGERVDVEIDVGVNDGLFQFFGILPNKGLCAFPVKKGLFHGFSERPVKFPADCVL